MKQNFQPAFVGHPGVNNAPAPTPRGNAPHAIWMFDRDWEYQVVYTDGIETAWKPLTRGTASPPVTAVEIRIRRQANGVVR